MLRSVSSSRARNRRGLRIVGVVTALGLIMPAAGAVVPKLKPRGGKASSGNYIVMLKPSVGNPDEVAEDQTDRPGASLGSVFRTLKGYSGTFRSQDIEAVRRDPRTELVARDDTVHTMAVGPQTPAPFGLDRVDQRFRPLDNTFAANNDGDVPVFVLDTGILASHTELAGRVDTAAGATFINDGRGTTDCNGHGTHVSGIIAGKTYGVAKAARLIPVRTLNCSGSASTSTVIAAVDFVTKSSIKPAIANMSLGGSSNSALDLAVQKAIASGVAFSLAAGNGNFLGMAANACNTSPARIGKTLGAMTIGASDINDNKASFSNYGDCVDWFAPGVNIVSSWYSSTTATRSLSGTSMAAPYTAGVAALYLDAHDGATPKEIEEGLLNLSQQSAFVGSSRTVPLHSHIVFTGRGGTGEVL